MAIIEANNTLVADSTLPTTEELPEAQRLYPLLTEHELLALIVNRNSLGNGNTMLAADVYSPDAFILRTAPHNHLLHEAVPPGSYVMLDPRAEACDNSLMAFALLDQNAIAVGVRDCSWDGYFISLGDRAIHITSKRCKPLWPALAVIGYELNL